MTEIGYSISEWWYLQLPVLTGSDLARPEVEFFRWNMVVFKSNSDSTSKIKKL